VFVPIPFFCKVSLLAILVDRKLNDARMKLFFHPDKTVYVKEMSISLYFQ
jgi:hypothetical protein